MATGEKANLSVCEKSMTVMLRILKVSAVSLSHLTVGAHGSGKVRPASEFDVGLPLLNPASQVQQAPDLMLPDILKKPRALSVDRHVKPVEADLDKRSSDYIQDMRRRISSEADSEAGDMLKKPSGRP